CKADSACDSAQLFVTQSAHQRAGVRPFYLSRGLSAHPAHQPGRSGHLRIETKGKCDLRTIAASADLRGSAREFACAFERRVTRRIAEIVEACPRAGRFQQPFSIRAYQAHFFGNSISTFAVAIVAPS